MPFSKSLCVGGHLLKGAPFSPDIKDCVDLSHQVASSRREDRQAIKGNILAFKRCFAFVEDAKGLRVLFAGGGGEKSTLV